MKLNPAQQEAVTYISGPCLVLAGAGSGKTRVITNKIAYMIQECGHKARNIAAVTFTNKAAREMRERIGQTLGKAEARGLMVSTFHTLGLNIIRREHKVLGLKENFSLFDEHDVNALLVSLTEDELEGDKDAIRQLISTISNWKNEMVSPKQAMATAQDEHFKQLAEFYDRYQRQMVAYNALDFDDLILLPCLLLKENAEVRERWQNRIRYLLVDEYQDTNTAQYDLVKLIVGSNARFTVVGDDDQSIYSWRGARPQNLELLKTDFPALRLIKLEQNYRSSGRILKAANILIANNPHAFEKRLFSELGYGVPLRVLFAKDEEHEADRVTSELSAHKFINKTAYRDYAILYRGNHQSRLFEMSLMRNRIPYKISGGTSFFSRAEIKDMMAYLRLLVNADDDNSFLRIINVPKRGIGPTSLEKLGLFANERGIGLFAAACDAHLSSVISGKPLFEIQRFTRWMVELSDNAVRSETTDVVRELVRGIHYEDWLYETSASAKAAEMRMKNVSELYRWITEMLEGDELEQPMTLQEVVTRLMLRDMMERNESEENADQVQLMTLHASKGLEYPFVFMVGMEEGLLPHQVSMDEDNVDEERRLAYVGITRAQQALTFTLCKSRRQYGEVIKPEPSRFLLELPQDDVEWESRTQKTAEQKQQTGRAGIANLKAILGNKG
ncbi:DNA helicase Rep [Echinimonas agarilytica]|uniref:ATP-dependent DNA helicase Rep n=1 Tax=Echinimonas agarilytica TaxID=1215918 RepID=A0AA41W3P3_9GAMM|nr:DNA helicase Rep [Echinimonas agarilytica]MCM2678214.1 DNA helicase Rep [Echinimonas agarilytica]